MLLVVFAGFALLTSGIYLLMPLQGAIGTGLSFILLPGVAMYSALNGSLLFGAGFGPFGNGLIIVIGSAAAWTSLVVAFCGAPGRQ
ncbi:MAG: hypothetical protein DCF23_13755 [Cyanobium sp.]|nr:MAG: hypothetical protein DCF23_13755 [Cyanobium sp.]